MKFRLLITLLSLASICHAQFTQQLRGTVVDQLLQQPLSGATVMLPSLKLSVISDEEGNFRFRDLPIGSYKLVVSFTGFRESVIDNIAINSGKETVLTIPMEGLIKTEQEIIIKGNTRKNRPLNDLSVVSARAFTVEETQKYAAAVNDPLRMAMAFPGVQATDDGNNQIIIRGNSPAGLLWRMEGMDIPNPNHFSTIGSSGGGVSILSAQLLANSDFVTAAFPAEYGNGLSGVFDLKLRKGNNEKREYSLQAGVLGINGTAEGPFSKNYKGSYLVNYRYSTLSLLNRIGVVPNESVTNFQDLSYNIYLPTNKLGNFTLFGFGGLSSDQDKDRRDSSKWEDKSDRYAYDFSSNTAMNGLTHTILLGSRANVRTGLGYSATRNRYTQYYTNDDYSTRLDYKDSYRTRKWNANTTLNYKFSNRLNLRAGFIAQWLDFNYYQLSSEHDGWPLEEKVNTKGKTTTQQAFGQLQYRVSNSFTISGGLHYLHLDLNNTSAIEPRFSARWNIDEKNSLSAGVGVHSQLQALGVYFAQALQPDNSYKQVNRDLGLTKARHYVLSYSRKLARDLLLKTEVYYQDLYNVPVSLKPGSTFSTLNIVDEYTLDPLANKGTGKNYGLELSLERYLRNNFYYMLTGSFYESKYKAYDQVMRDTRFNGNYISTFIIGKDFESFLKTKTFGINLKTIVSGGLRTTPIDLEASREEGYTVFIEDKAYSIKNPMYFRSDLRLSMKWNRKRFTSTLSLDIQNITNRLNIFNQWYDDTKGAIVTSRQAGLIPILNYKIEF